MFCFQGTKGVLNKKSYVSIVIDLTQKPVSPTCHRFSYAWLVVRLFVSEPKILEESLTHDGPNLENNRDSRLHERKKHNSYDTRCRTAISCLVVSAHGGSGCMQDSVFL